MSHEEANSIGERLTGIEACLEKLTTAIQGDPSMEIDGLVQHIRLMKHGIAVLERDVKSLKDDRRTVKGWLAGVAAAGGVGGWVGHWFAK